MSAKVLLDLNLPAFQDDLFALEPNEVRLILKTLRKLRGLHWPRVHRSPGLQWVQVKEAPGKCMPRLSRSRRAVPRRDGDCLRFIALPLAGGAAPPSHFHTQYRSGARCASL